jgi:hypothetical protein
MSISLYGKTVFGFSGEVKGFVGFAIFAARFSEFAEYPGAEAMHQARELRITNLIATFRRLENSVKKRLKFSINLPIVAYGLDLFISGGE